ncbi:MAG: helix-turn-helix domain-containing protein, partial [Catenulispora sp.]|nr:helix-turn-helix domain-containing protein [Catenulispora sp.]
MLEILLLGPVEAWAGAVRVPLAPLERDLLTLLALQPGTVSSTDRIIDGLWGERPPAAPRSRVQGLVSGLRRKVGAALVTRQPGYLLDLPSEATDLGRCEALARRVRAAPTPTDKAGLARQALGLWRGEPLDGA